MECGFAHVETRPRSELAPRVTRPLGRRATRPGSNRSGRTPCVGSRREDERDLAARAKRHDSLDIKPLPSGVRDRYARDWASVQEEFVDRPEGAVHDADSLVGSLMRERGYPTEDFEQQVKDLSVEHYRAAHEVNGLSIRHQATTEQLRGALVHYRALFDELLTDGGERYHARA
ncbi:hypothetical protein [Streptomyces sp. NPDC001070]